MNLLAFTNFFDSNTYNYWIEVGALIFLACLLVRFFAAKKFLSKVNIIFGAAILCGILDLSLDITACLLLENLDSVPTLLAKFVNGSFYFFQICFPCLLLLFLIYIAGISSETRKRLMYLFIPAIIYFLILTSNGFSNLVFNIEEVDGKLTLVHGPLFAGLWIVAAFYIITTFVFVLRLRNKIEKPLVSTMLFSVSFIFVMLAIQIFVPKYLLTGIAISLTCWANYEHLTDASNMTDKVSGVYNYNAYLSFLKHNVDYSKKQYFIVCVVSNVTQINSTFGILTGNHLYRELGNFFSSLNNRNCWVFRLSTSRFVIHFKDRISLKKSLDDIETKFDEPWRVDGMYFDINCTGFYINSNIQVSNASDYIDFISSLELRVKKHTPESFICVDQQYIETIARAKSIETALRKSIENGFKGLEMYYQPIYQVESESFNHSEALIRFKDPTLGNISPSEFIPVAESCGLAAKIDRFVLKTTCDFLRKNPSIDFLDINVSGAEFFNNPSRDFIKIVKKSGVDPRKLCLEVTETATVEYPEKFEEFMKEMSLEGFSFAIDDFGTGYSNISRVISKSFNIVKLDKSFLVADEKISKILNAVISLLHSLNVPMVIEGVETQEQFERMRDFGIQYIQGFYFSKPLPEEQFVEFIAQS